MNGSRSKWFELAIISTKRRNHACQYDDERKYESGGCDEFIVAKHVTRGALTFLGKLKVGQMNHKVTTPPPLFVLTTLQRIFIHQIPQSCRSRIAVSTRRSTPMSTRSSWSTSVRSLRWAHSESDLPLTATKDKRLTPALSVSSCSSTTTSMA